MGDAAFNKILEELKDIKDSNSEIKKSNLEIRKELKAANEKILKDFQEFKTASEIQVKELKSVLSKIKEENLELKRSVNQLVKKTVTLESEVSHLNEGFNRLQQERLSDQFVIPGIPIVEGEDLASLIIKIGVLLNIELKKADFSVIRLKANNKASNTLLVQSNQKKIIFQQRKNKVILLDQLGFASTSTSKEVYFYHQLTKFNHDLLITAKAELKKTNLVKFVWFQNNKVLVRQSSKSPFYSVHSNKEILKLVSTLKAKESESKIIDLVSPAQSE